MVNIGFVILNGLSCHPELVSGSKVNIGFSHSESSFVTLKSVQSLYKKKIPKTSWNNSAVRTARNKKAAHTANFGKRFVCVGENKEKENGLCT